MTNAPKKESLIERVGALYNLLKDRFPDFESVQGHLDVGRLAKAMGYSHETLYRCVRTNVIKVPVALQIIKFSQENASDPLYWQDLMEFVLPEFKALSAPVDADE